MSNLFQRFNTVVMNVEVGFGYVRSVAIMIVNVRKNLMIKVWQCAEGPRLFRVGESQ